LDIAVEQWSVPAPRGGQAAEPRRSAGPTWNWRALLPARGSATGRPTADRLLLLVTLALVGLGIVMIYSASAIRAQERFGDPSFFLKKQLVYAVLGLLAMAWAAGRDLKTFQRVTPILLLGSLFLLLLVLVPYVGVRINGARRWIRFFGLSFQPAELAKMAVILFLASYFARRQDRLDSYLDGFVPPLFVTGILAGLIILQPNFGTVAILMGVAVVMFFIGGARLTHLLATGAAALPLFLVLSSSCRSPTRISSSPSWARRWDSWAACWSSCSSGCFCGAGPEWRCGPATGTPAIWPWGSPGSSSARRRSTWRW